MTLRAHLRPLIALLALPGTLAHELTHAIASLPWAQRLALVVEPRSGRAAVRVDWRETAGDRARAIAALAPLVGGTVALIAAINLWVRGGLPVLQSAGVLQWGLVAAWWSVYMVPSEADRETARGDRE